MGCKGFIRTVAGILLAGITLFAHASVHHQPYRNNTQLTVSLSDNDLNKLAVTGDTIIGIASPQGMLNQSRNPDGSVYLRTLQDTPFTVFVSTKDDHPFSVLVIPKSEPGQTWLLNPLSQGNNKNTAHWEKSIPYPELLITVMKSITNNQTPAHFIKVPLNKKEQNKNVKVEGFQLTPDVLWRGNQLVAIRYRIINLSTQSKSLEERRFFSSGVRAVALSAQNLPAKGKGWVYEILSASKGVRG